MNEAAAKSLRWLFRALAVLVLAAGLVVAGWLVLAATWEPDPPVPDPPGSFSFAALGDAPYGHREPVQYREVLRDMAAHDLAFVLHVGDVMGRPCVDARYAQTLERFGSVPHPVIYTPGDNEWTDCARMTPSFEPLERLAKIRRDFYADPSRSLGGRTIALEHQGRDSTFAEFVENARWVQDGVVFATVHLVGSRNAREPYAGRTAADDEASLRRTEAATAWLRETFALARETDAPAVVLGFHASLALEDPPEDDYRAAYEPFIQALEEEAVEFGRPVLLVHGDWHEYTVDRPLRRRATGETIPNVRRVQVPGSPDVGWVRVTVTPGEAEPFGFEPRVVPRWVMW